MTRAASIDIGTNSIRLLVAEIDGMGNLKKIMTRRKITRLGEDFVRTGRISPKAMGRSAKVLEEYANLLKECNIRTTVAVATSIVREAANRDEFLQQVYQSTGLEVTVISGDEEARIALIGILSIIDDLVDRAVVVDIGGGSTEFIVVQGKVPLATYSTELGSVYLTERFIQSDPPSTAEVGKLEVFINNRLSSMLRCSFEAQTGTSFSFLVGTAGTITTLAAMDQKMNVYDQGRINRYVLTRESVKIIYKRLQRIPVPERYVLPGLEKGREDIILAGTAVVVKIMEVLGFHEMIVSDYGLLEGIILSCFSPRRENAYP